MSTPLSVGKTAPDFTLMNQHGQPVQLSALRGQPVVVFFYPKDGTGVCTQQACAFRDAFEDLTNLGAVILGISNDGESSHAGFAAKNNLPFSLLSDPGGKTRALWGVPKTLGILPGRVTYVLDAGGVVRHIFSAQLATEQHVQEAQKALNLLDKAT